MHNSLLFCSSGIASEDCDVRLLHENLEDFFQNNSSIISSFPEFHEHVNTNGPENPLYIICHGNESGEIVLEDNTLVNSSFWSDKDSIKFVFIFGCFSYKHLTGVNKHSLMNYGGVANEIVISLPKKNNVKKIIFPVWAIIIEEINNIVSSNEPNYIENKILLLLERATRYLKNKHKDNPEISAILVTQGQILSLRDNIKFWVKNN